MAVTHGALALKRQSANSRSPAHILHATALNTVSAVNSLSRNGGHVSVAVTVVAVTQERQAMRNVQVRSEPPAALDDGAEVADRVDVPQIP